MSQVLETEVYGDPAACTSAASRVRGVRTSLSDSRDAVDSAMADARAWRGLAADSFQTRARMTSNDLHELESRVKAMETALDDFAGELKVVETRMAHARSVATAGGVAVSGTTITCPTAPDVDVATQGQVDAYNAKVDAWNEAVEIVDGARTKEQEAHQNLADGITGSTGDGWLEDLMERLGFAPPDFPDGVDLGAWMFGLGGLAFGATTGFMVNGRYGVFQPRVNGRFASPAGLTFWQRMKAGTNPDNFHAGPGMAGSRNAWARAGKIAGHAGTVVTALTSGWDQWQSDADDPSLDTSDRVSRATTKGVSTAAGAWAGGEAGAWAGGAIGTAICPGVGTVVGGVVGGLVGGAVGAFAGSEFGDLVMDGVSDAVDATQDFLGDAADTAGDIASDVGDAITFWD